MADKHAERTKQHAIKWVGAVLIVALLVGSIVVYPNEWKSFLSFASPGTATTTLVGSNSCPPNSQAGTLTWLASNYTPVTGGVAYVATPSNITTSAGGSNYQQVISNTKLTTSGVAFTTGQCGASYRSIVGDNLNWYENQTVVTSEAGLNIPVIVQTFQYSAPTALIANSPQQAGASTGNVFGVGTGALVTNFQESIQAGRGFAGYPGEGFDVVYAYNSLAITGITLNGQACTVTSLPITYVNGQNAQCGFVFPSIHFSQYGTPSGATSSYTLFNPQFQMGAGFSGAAQNSIVQQVIAPLGNYQGVNGQWYTGAATFGVPGIISGQSVGTLVLPATTSSAFIDISHA